MSATYLQYRLETPALRELICSAWAQSYGGDVDTLPGLIAPDAHIEVVFQLGAPCAMAAGEAERVSPRAMVYGLRHGALRLKPTGENAMAAFRMSPAVASVVLRSRLVDCWDHPIALADIIGPEAHDVLERLAAAPLPGAGAVIESWLLGRLTGWDADHERQVQLQSALLWNAGWQRVSAVADGLGFTERTLRRHCETHAGLSPKQLMMSGRMLRACDLIRGSARTPLAEAALRLGFTDQSAFSNAFRHYLGMTPAQLRAEPLVHYQPPG